MSFHNEDSQFAAIHLFTGYFNKQNQSIAPALFPTNDPVIFPGWYVLVTLI